MNRYPDFGEVYHARSESRIAFNDLVRCSTLQFHRSDGSDWNARAFEDRLAANHAFHALDDLVRLPDRFANVPSVSIRNGMTRWYPLFHPFSSDSGCGGMQLRRKARPVGGASMSQFQRGQISW